MCYLYYNMLRYHSFVQPIDRDKLNKVFEYMERQQSEAKVSCCSFLFFVLLLLSRSTSTCRRVMCYCTYNITFAFFLLFIQLRVDRENKLIEYLERQQSEVEKVSCCSLFLFLCFCFVTVFLVPLDM